MKLGCRLVEADFGENSGLTTPRFFFVVLSFIHTAAGDDGGN